MPQIYHFWQPCMSYLPVPVHSRSVCQTPSADFWDPTTLLLHVLLYIQVLHTGTKQLQPLQKRRVGLISKRTRIFLQVSFLESKSMRSLGFLMEIRRAHACWRTSLSSIKGWCKGHIGIKIPQISESYTSRRAQ